MAEGEGTQLKEEYTGVSPEAAQRITVYTVVPYAVFLATVLMAALWATFVWVRGKARQRQKEERRREKEARFVARDALEARHQHQYRSAVGLTTRPSPSPLQNPQSIHGEGMRINRVAGEPSETLKSLGSGSASTSVS